MLCFVLLNSVLYEIPFWGKVVFCNMFYEMLCFVRSCVLHSKATVP